MAKYTLKRKIFTKWDETDNLKQMKDSDILSQQKHKQSLGQTGTTIIGDTLKGAAIGGGLMAGAGLLKGASGKTGLVNKMAGAGKSAAKLGKVGLISGAVIGAAKAANSINNQANENSFYNDRLKYAQRQAKRRERKDWKNNMTNRDGYTY